MKGQFENEFLFYLLNIDGKYYYEEEDGSVQVQVDPIPLQYAPEGWLDTKISYTRSIEYWGLFRKFTEPYVFHKDGHNIVSYIKTTQGIEGYCKLMIKRYDYANASPNVVLNTFYEGELDFSSCTISRTSSNIPIMEGGVRDMFSAFENTSFEIPIEDFDADTIKFDGIDLQAKLNFVQMAHPEVSVPQAGEQFFPMIFVNQDGDYTIGQTADFDPSNDSASFLNYETFGQFKPIRTMDISVKFDGFFNYSLGIGATDAIRLSLRAYVFANAQAIDDGDQPLNGNITSNNGTPTATTIWTDPVDLDPGDDRTIGIQTTWNYTVNEGNIVVFVLKAYHPNGVVTGSNWGLTSGDGTHTISATFQLPMTDAKGYRYFKVAQKLFEDKITSGAGSFASSFFGTGTAQVDNVPINTIVTSGSAIRGIADAKIKTSWAELWKDARTQWCLGLTVDSTSMVMEKLEYFLDNATEIYDFGEVSRCEHKPFKEALFSTIKVGYADQEYDGLNGRYESMTTQTYKMPCKRPTATMDLVGSYRYDPYGIELYRDRLSFKDSTDDRADNEVFVVEVADSFPYIPRRKQNEGVNYATYNDVDIDFLLERYYNIAFSPKRKLFRNGAHVKAALHLISDTITFETSDKNQLLVSDLGFGEVRENQDVLSITSELGDFVYLPIIFELDTPIRDDFFTAIQAENKGYISFSYNGYTFKGFPMEVDYTPANKTQRVTLLATPDLNMSDLHLAFLD